MNTDPKGQDRPNHHEINVNARFAWTRGALKTVAIAVVTALAGLVAFWDKLAKLVGSNLPVVFLCILTSFVIGLNALIGPM